MKQFRQLLQIDQPVPTRNNRTLSFQALAKHSQRYAQPKTINEKLQKIVEKEIKVERAQQPKSARDRISNHPDLNLLLRPTKKPQDDQIEGIAIITSLTVSSEDNHDIAIKLNSEEQVQITARMHEIKDELIKELMWNKRKLGYDLNGTLKGIKKELDVRTEQLVDDVLARRNNKELYLAAREQVKVYFSKKKEDKPVREKTLGTPCFEQISNNKSSNNKQSSCNSLNNTIDYKKGLPSTGHKLTVTKKSGGSKTVQDIIQTHRGKDEEIHVQQFKLQ